MPIIWLLGMWLYASASDYSYVEDENSDNLYSPATLITEWGDISSFTLWECSHSVCEFSLLDSSSNVVYSVADNCSNASSLSNCLSSLNWKSIEAWNYTVWANNYEAFSTVSFTISSSSDSSDSDWIITIPSNFVSGLNSLLTNFWNTIVNWLPTIILLWLGIVAVFSLFRVVRNYSKKSFKW